MIVGQPLHTHSLVEAVNGVVSAGHAAAAEAGVRAMQAGGNAVDALTAAAFAAFVAEPASCGIGGYAHISVWSARQKRFVSIDAYSRAPLAARPDMFEVADATGPTYYGHPFTKGDAAMTGFRAVSVPGAVAGFCEAQAWFGVLPLGTVLEPAISLAEAGVPFTWSDTIHIAGRCLGADIPADAAAVLLPGGKPPPVPMDRPGTLGIDTAPLARVLKAVAEKGAAGFHAGWVAETLERYMAANGGLITREDLSAYRTRTLLERPARYRGHGYVSCYDQVCYEALNILNGFDLASHGPDSLEYRHLVAEALAVAFTDSMTHYGDPAFVSSPVDGLASPAFAAERRGLIGTGHALPRPVAAGDPWPHQGNEPSAGIVTDPVSLARRDGTSQAAAADREGNVASCCISVGSGFGSLVYVPELGIFLNNAMQNYDPRPGLPNSIAPGKMPIFAAPAIVAERDGEGVFAASGSGGYRIEPGVVQTMLNVIDHGMAAQRAVDHPRIHCQGGDTHVDPRVGAAVLAGLEALGHQVVRQPESPGIWAYGRVCAVTRDPATGALSGGAGPGWHTAVAGF
jgi:gamma-glutamyltranspeptidase/glutathione hydrolase